MAAIRSIIRRPFAGMARSYGIGLQTCGAAHCRRSVHAQASLAVRRAKVAARLASSAPIRLARPWATR